MRLKMTIVFITGSNQLADPVPNKISISPIRIVGQKIFRRIQKTGISKIITIVLNVSGTIIFTTPPKVP